MSYGTGQFIIATNYDQLVAKVMEYTGISKPQVMGATSKLQTALKGGGKVLFYVGSAVSIGMLANHTSQGDYNSALKDYVDLTMGVVGTLGPVGFVIGGSYFIVDQTVGWGWVTGMPDSAARQMWNDYNSGKRSSKFLDR